MSDQIENDVDVNKDSDKPTNPYGYDKLTKVELRKAVADLTKSVLELKADKKDYVGAANEAIKETNTRIESAIYELKWSESTGADSDHELKVVEFLSAVKDG